MGSGVTAKEKCINPHCQRRNEEPGDTPAWLKRLLSINLKSCPDGLNRTRYRCNAISPVV